MRIKSLLIASAAMAVVALPALAQQSAPTQPAPAANQYPNNSIGPTIGRPSAAPASTAIAGTDDSAVEEVGALNLPPPPLPVEYPGWARRDLWTVGVLDPGREGLGHRRGAMPAERSCPP